MIIASKFFLPLTNVIKPLNLQTLCKYSMIAPRGLELHQVTKIWQQRGVLQLNFPHYPHKLFLHFPFHSGPKQKPFFAEG